jgi:hypothetical protein
MEKQDGMTDERARIIVAMRQRFAAYWALTQQERDLLDDGRLIPVKETEELFEQAMRGDELTTWPKRSFRVVAWQASRLPKITPGEILH